VNRATNEHAKKLRAILRDHYTRDDMSVSLTELLADARHLAAQRGLPFERLELDAQKRFQEARAEAVSQ
jgi:hypothetical protein